MTVFRKLPKSVRIKNHAYKITHVKSPDSDRKKNLDGVIWFDDKIEINKNLSRLETESTIIHEVLHGIGHHFKIKLTETMVIALENALVTVFRQNKWKITEKNKTKSKLKAQKKHR